MGQKHCKEKHLQAPTEAEDGLLSGYVFNTDTSFVVKKPFISDDFEVHDSQGDLFLRLEGAWGPRGQVTVFDKHDRQIAIIYRKLASVRMTYRIDTPGGKRLGTVHRKFRSWINPVFRMFDHHNVQVGIVNGTWHGNCYDFKDMHHNLLAQSSSDWIQLLGDKYAVRCTKNIDVLMVLLSCAIVDMAKHEMRRRMREVTTKIKK